LKILTASPTTKGTDIYKIYSGNENEAEKKSTKNSLKLFKKSINTSKKARQEKTLTGYIRLSTTSATFAAGRYATNTKPTDNTDSKHNYTAEQCNKHRHEDKRITCYGFNDIGKHTYNKVINRSHSPKHTCYSHGKTPFTLI
jgi:hypothetical protein